MKGWNGRVSALSDRPESEMRSGRSRRSALPPEPGRPSIARVYDYALGGKDHFAADRELFQRISAVYPEYRDFALANRRFLTRAVREMASAGVDQYLDLGAGIPTFPAVHDVVRDVIPDATVVYVDYDPVVAAHGRALLAQSPGVHVINLDLRRPSELLSNPTVRATIDFGRPLGLLCVAVLHFVGQNKARQLLNEFRTALAGGSFVAISAHILNPANDTPAKHQEGRAIADDLSIDIVARSPAEVAELFTGFTILDPGVVDIDFWRLGATSRPLWCLSGVGRLDRCDRPEMNDEV